MCVPVRVRVSSLSLAICPHKGLAAADPIISEDRRTDGQGIVPAGVNSQAKHCPRLGTAPAPGHDAATHTHARAHHNCTCSRNYGYSSMLQLCQDTVQLMWQVEIRRMDTLPEPGV